MQSYDNRLTTLFFEHRDKVIDKWEHYLAIYSRELAPLTHGGRPIRLLEIGVQNGGSLELWAKYLPAGSEVVGVDIDPKVGTLTFHGAIKAYVADATDSSNITSLLGDKVFDVIIDDGSHFSRDIVVAFELLYQRLAYGGKFIIEDLHASYWRHMGGGLRSPTSAVEFFKQLADALNIDHFESEPQLTLEDLERLKQYGRSLARITFYDSVIVLEKLPHKKNLPYRRVLGGIEAQVVDPFVGIADLPLAKIESLLFSEEQKHQIEAKFLDWFSSSRAKTQSLQSELAELHARTEAATASHLDGMAQRDQRIASLENDISKLNQTIAGLEANGADKQLLILSKDAALHQYEQEFVELRQQLRERDRQTLEAGGGAIERDRQIAVLQMELAQLRGSSSWRLTSPLRNIGLRLPPPVRRRLRQGVKLVWWCATLQIGTRTQQWQQLVRRRRVIAGPPPFDPAWYLKRYPDVGKVGMDPLDHYLAYGMAEGRIPSSGAGQKRARATIALQDRVRDGLSRRRGLKPQPTAQVIPTANHPSAEPQAQHWHLRELCDPYRQESVFASEDTAFKISVLTPTYNSVPHYLRELQQTLLNQHYTNWEWILVDDGSSDPGTILTLKELAASDPRVHVTMSPVNAGIAAATNVALGAASGTHAALVDHDDLVARDAFLKIYQAWQANPRTQLFYTDECKLYPDGTLGEFWPKPDWSPAYLENTMCIGHLTVYRTEFLKDLGGFRSAFDATQDYDLALRASLRKPVVQHLPIFAYLWRAIPGSAAVSLHEKHYAIERQARAVLEYAQQKNPAAIVSPGWGAGYWRIEYPLPSPCPLLSYVIPTGAGSRWIKGENVNLITNCIRSFERKNFYPNREYIVVHNGNLTQTQLAALNALPAVKLVHYDRPVFNFSEKINLGVSRAAGEYLCLLNDDVEASTPRGAEQLVGYLHANPSVGTIGPLCRLEDDTIQQNGIVLTVVGPAHAGAGQPWNFGGHQAMLRCRREAFAIGGAVMFIKKVLYQKLGGYAEDLPLNYNDIDFCIRLREQGYTCVVDPDVSVYHYESATKIGTCAVEQEKLFVKHPTMSDGYFNRWFEHGNTNYNLRLPLRDTEDFYFGTWLDKHIGHRSAALVTLGRCKLSVCVSVYNQSKRLLREMYTSVMMQTYDKKELVIVDNGSSNPETLDWLREVALEGRAKFVRLEQNAGISGGNRALLANMTGDFMVPMDADDFMTVDALQIMAHAIDNHPDAAVFYSDEFKSNMESTRFAPFFKPDFDPVLLMNCCYPAHLMTISRPFLQSIGAYDDDSATWCHDYDTLTRAMVAGQKPVHVRELIYAWRINPGSTASAATGAKPETVSSQTYVLNRLLRERGLDQVLRLEPNERNGGMWRLSALQPVPNVNILSASSVWTEAGGGLAKLVTAASEPRVEWLAILLSPDESRGLLELSAVAWLDPRVTVVSGLLVHNNGQTVQWSGGLFLPGGNILDPYAGLALSESGYHAQLWCQRCVDVPAPVNLLVRASALLRAAARLPPGAGADALAVMLGLDAHETDHLVAVTPQLRAALPDAPSIPLPLDRDGLAADADALRKGSRWYDGRLSASKPYTIPEGFM